MDVLSSAHTIGKADNSVGNIFKAVRWQRVFFYVGLLLSLLLVLLAIGVGAPWWFNGAAVMGFLIIVGWNEADNTAHGRFSFIYFLLILLSVVLLMIPGVRENWYLPLYLGAAIHLFA